MRPAIRWRIRSRAALATTSKAIFADDATALATPVAKPKPKIGRKAQDRRRAPTGPGKGPEGEKCNRCVALRMAGQARQCRARQSTVRFSFHSRHGAALPRTSGLGQQRAFLSPPTQRLNSSHRRGALPGSASECRLRRRRRSWWNPYDPTRESGRNLNRSYPLNIHSDRQ
jgi:hypothetical protein